MRTNALTIFVLLLVTLASGCAVNPVTGRQDFVLMSEQQELALGKQASQQVLQQYSAYADVSLQAYVNSIGQKLAEVSHRSELNYHFTVLDSTEINAFALPGGHIYITRGLLAYMNSEAELAAVLGHEIGHVTARHSVRQQTANQAAGIGAGLLSIFLPQASGAGLNQVTNIVGTALLRGYGREHELEADRLGAEYLARTAYDPNAMLDVIRTLKNHELFDQRLAAEEGREARAYHGLFSTHPDNDKRLREVIDYAKNLDATKGERYRNRFLDEIDGLIIGPNPAQGIFDEHHFYHPDLGFAFDIPTGWQGQNLPDRIIAVAPKGAAQLIVVLNEVNQGEDARGFLQRYGIKDLNAGRKLKADSLVAYTGLSRVDMSGGKRNARVSAILFRDNGYIFLGVAAQQGKLKQYDKTFLASARSFHAITAKEKRKAKPKRLRVVKRKGTVSWQALAAASPLETLAEDQLRLLNGASSDGSDGPTEKRMKIVVVE